MSIAIYRYETPLDDLLNHPWQSIFLAGPTVRGNQQHLTSWRFEAIDIFKKISDEYMLNVNLIIPEFTDKTESDKGKDWIPAWEFMGLEVCDIALFWIPRTKELIGLTTNHEHGYRIAMNYAKVIHGRPDDSYRNEYLDLMMKFHAIQHDMRDLPPARTLEETIRRSMDFARSKDQLVPSFDGKFLHRNKSKVPVHSPYPRTNKPLII